MQAASLSSTPGRRSTARNAGSPASEEGEPPSKRAISGLRHGFNVNRPKPKYAFT